MTDVYESGFSFETKVPSFTIIHVIVFKNSYNQEALYLDWKHIFPRAGTTLRTLFLHQYIGLRKNLSSDILQFGRPIIAMADAFFIAGHGKADPLAPGIQ